MWRVLDRSGETVTSGVYRGKPIRLSMRGMETGPEFGVFVLSTIVESK